MNNTDNRHVILLTGATGGIGQITAHYLSNKGYIVYGTSRREQNDTDLPYHMLKLDVTDEESVSECVTSLLQKEGKIDCLINGAGFAYCGALSETTVDQMKEQFETNFFGTHRIIRSVLPHMLGRQQGKIINIGSFGGRLGLPFQGLYSSSKAALAMYSDTLRMELKRKGIAVSLVEPGDIATDFHEGRKYVENYDKDPVAIRAIEIMHKSEQNGTNPLKVAKKIHKIIKAKRLKPRYTVGPDAFWVGLLQRLLPFSIAEQGIMINYKIPRKKETK